jgi:hypothetical protein
MDDKIPSFTADGLLPPGDYPVTLAELRISKLVFGPCDPKDCPNWDAAWREKLVDNLSILVRQLMEIGIDEIFAAGSFVEDKDHHNDIDGYFVCSLTDLASGKLQRELNLLDKYKIWTWDPSSRKPYKGYPKKQLPMWHQYRIELYPHVREPIYQPTGIKDRFGNDLEFPSAFRQSRRDGKQKGIISIRRE